MLVHVNRHLVGNPFHFRLGNLKQQRCNKMKLTFLLISFTLFLFCCSVTAQISGAETLPRLKFDKNNKLIGIYDTGKNTDWTCHKSVQNLRLVRILYNDEENADIIGNLIFADTKGRREEYVFSLTLSEFSTVDSSHLHLFIAQGNKYKVGAYRCGAGGKSDPFIYSLASVVSPKRKQTKSKEKKP
jgi:hypothetical protein